MTGLPPMTDAERRAELTASIFITVFMIALIGGAWWFMQ